MRKQREVLPSSYDMAIAEVNQRFYPIRIQTTEEGDLVFSYIAQFTWSFEDEWFIPYAIGPRHTTGVVSFPTYAEAINFCHRREEHWGLLFDWEKHLATTDPYPERSAWYVDEIQRLAGAAPDFSTVLTEAHAWVWYADRAYHDVYASNMHEAIVALYEDLYQTYGSTQHDVSCISDTEMEYA